MHLKFENFSFLFCMMGKAEKKNKKEEKEDLPVESTKVWRVRVYKTPISAYWEYL